MQDLIKQEKFELEVLEKLNSKRFLDNLLFCGGTMLRLCYELNRYSVDIDFWLSTQIDTEKLFKEMKKYLENYYILKDHANKHFTILFELRSKNYPRSLKIEIRKEVKNVKTEQSIAYSKNSNIQVLVKVPALSDMMNLKIEAFLDRNEIRDVFDIEFLLKKGVELQGSKDNLEKMIDNIENFKKTDYDQKLCSLLEEGQRKYYRESNFKILKSAIQEKLSKE